MVESIGEVVKKACVTYKRKSAEHHGESCSGKATEGDAGAQVEWVVDMSQQLGSV